jgi:hypothetical protein
MKLVYLVGYIIKKLTHVSENFLAVSAVLKIGIIRVDARPHCLTCQKKVSFMVTVVRTSYLMCTSRLLNPLSTLWEILGLVNIPYLCFHLYVTAVYWPIKFMILMSFFNVICVKLRGTSGHYSLHSIVSLLCLNFPADLNCCSVSVDGYRSVSDTFTPTWPNVSVAVEPSVYVTSPDLYDLLDS